MSVRELSQREAALFVACELALGVELSKTGRPALAPDEKALFSAALRASGTYQRMVDLGLAVKRDGGDEAAREVARLLTPRGTPPPTPALSGGRTGRPARESLRAALRDLLAHVGSRRSRADGYGVKKCAALLVLLYGFDTHPVFWRRDKTKGAPPTDYARVRWLTERIGDLTEQRDGQYSARRAKRTPNAKAAVDGTRVQP